MKYRPLELPNPGPAVSGFNVPTVRHTDNNQMESIATTGFGIRQSIRGLHSPTKNVSGNPQSLTLIKGRRDQGGITAYQLQQDQPGLAAARGISGVGIVK